MTVRILNRLKRDLRHLFAIAVTILGVFILAQDARASNSVEVEVESFFQGYFETVRWYDRAGIIEYLSRERLASNLQQFSSSPNDASVIQTAKFMFNSSFIFGAYCRANVLSIQTHDSDTDLLVRFDQGKNRKEKGNVYNFLLVRETGKLRLDRIVAADANEKMKPRISIDICDIPINWENPSLLKPGESLEEQQERLGIPK